MVRTELVVGDAVASVIVCALEERWRPSVPGGLTLRASEELWRMRLGLRGEWRPVSHWIPRSFFTAAFVWVWEGVKGRGPD
jgi:hypothetical protein